MKTKEENSAYQLAYRNKRKKEDPLFVEKSREANRKSYRKNRAQEKPEEKNIRLKKRRERKKVKREDLKARFGLTLDQYSSMFLEQNGLCAICRQPETSKISRDIENEGRIRRLAVDHDHTTEKVRQLLCSKCNAVIGFAKEDILILESAIQYLKKHKEISSHG